MTMGFLSKLKTPAARLEFLETALAPQIAEAEASIAQRQAAERAAAIRSRDDELARLDAEMAELKAAHADAGKKLDAATKAFRAAEAVAVPIVVAINQASAMREIVRGRWERTIGALGNDLIETTLYRLRWLARNAAERLELERIAESKRRPNDPSVPIQRIPFDADALAQACAPAFKTVEALANAAVSRDVIERTCADELARCEAVAGESLMRWAPWAVSYTAEAH